MTAYKVLVSHRDLRMKTVVHLEPTQQVQYLVEAGYLKKIEEVNEVEGTGSRDVGVDHPVRDLPRKRRGARKTEVVDEPDRAVSDAGPADSEEQGA